MEIAVLHGHEGDVNHCHWSPIGDDHLLVSAGGDKTIKIWKTNTSNKKITPTSSLGGHTYYVNSCTFNASGDLIASCSSDGSVRLWSTVTWKTVGVLSGHKGPVRMCCFSNDGVLIASASGDQSVCVWETSSLKCLSTFDKHDCSVICCSFASVGWLLASGGSSGELFLFDVFKNKQLKKVMAHDMGVNWLEFAVNSGSSDVFTLATVGQDSLVKLWKIYLGPPGQSLILKEETILRGHISAVYSCHFSPDMIHLATGSADKTVIIWNVNERKLVHKIDAHGRYVTYCCFSPDGKVIASASNDRTIKLWNIEGLIKDVHQKDTNSVSEDSKEIVSLSEVSKCDHPVIPEKSLDEVFLWLEYLKEMEDKKEELNEQEIDSVGRISGLINALQQVSTKNEILKCPITQEQFQDPVVAADGYTYERSAIMSWFMEGNRRSPTTNVTLPNTTLFPNYLLKSLVRK